MEVPSVGQDKKAVSARVCRNPRAIGKLHQSPVHRCVRHGIYYLALDMRGCACRVRNGGHNAARKRSDKYNRADTFYQGSHCQSSAQLMFIWMNRHVARPYVDGNSPLLSLKLKHFPAFTPSVTKPTKAECEHRSPGGPKNRPDNLPDAGDDWKNAGEVVRVARMS